MGWNTWNICISFVVFLMYWLSEVAAEFCPDYGHECIAPHKCCMKACCIPTNLEDHYQAHLRWSVWNMWYFWFVVLFVLMSCFGGCSYYRRHQLLLARQQSMLGNGMTPGGYTGWRFPPAFPVSLFSGYSTRSTHQRSSGISDSERLQPDGSSSCVMSPPPYSEVMSLPQMYPPHKDTSLPPYPGPVPVPVPHYTECLPAYSGPLPQLPPYSPQEGDTHQQPSTLPQRPVVNGSQTTPSQTTEDHS